jgi:hypothetical protein
LVFQREEVEAHGLSTIDNSLGPKSGLGLGLIEDEGFAADVKSFVHGYGRKRSERGVEQPVLGRERGLGELKLLELIYGLLTTTGSGCLVS